MVLVSNKSNGPRGAYLKGVAVMANVGEVIEADDFSDEWFLVKGDEVKPKPNISDKK